MISDPSAAFTIKKLGGEFNGRNHTRMISLTLSGYVERRAVIDRGANEREAECDIDRFAE